MRRESVKAEIQRTGACVRKHKVTAALLLLLLVSRLLCIFLPLHGVNIDEASIDYNIFCISEYGTDRYGNPFPVYFANYISGQSALYVYLGVFLTKLIGFSVERCRLVKLVGEVITFVYGGRVVRSFFSDKAALIFRFLYIICPYFFKMSGISYDCDLIIPVFVLCIYCSQQCLKTGKTSWYIRLGVCVGLLSYSYILGALMAPLFLIYQFIAVRKKKVFYTAAVTAALDIPIAWYVLTLLHIAPEVHLDYLTIARVSSSRLKDLGFSLDNLRSLKYMLVTDPIFDIAGSISFGTIYQLSWIFMLVGFVVFLRSENRNKKLRLAGLTACAFFPLLCIKEASTYNYTVLYFFLLMFTAAGIDALFRGYKTLGWITVAAYLVMFGVFCGEYFTEETYLYSDDLLIAAIEDAPLEGRVMLDTTGVIQPDCYIGIALRADPKAISYDDTGHAVSFGNIVFNDYANYRQYDTVFIRKDILYVYQPTPYSGLTDRQVKEIMDYYRENGYEEKEIKGYFVFSRSKA